MEDHLRNCTDRELLDELTRRRLSCSGEGPISTAARGTYLTFRDMTAINTERANAWHNGFPKWDPTDPTDWNAADWSNAMLGEAGEFANVIKKIRRKETTTGGAVDPDLEVLKRMAGDEAADVQLYLDLNCTFHGIHLPTAIVRKFNFISEREGLPQRL